MKFRLLLLQTGFSEKPNQSSINTPQLSAAEYFQGKSTSGVGNSTLSTNAGFPQMPQLKLDVPDFLKKD